MYNANIRKEDLPAVSDELEAVRAKNKARMLLPVDVVNRARSQKSPLHPYFEWDDGEAADLYRQEQARSLIRVVVATVDGSQEPVSAYVRLSSDGRSQGYRHVVDVLGDEQLAAQMVSDALTELDRWRERYRRVQSLTDLREAMDRETAKLKKTETKRAGARTRRSTAAVAVANPG